MAVRFLDPVLINQIAAGEVVERPSSVLKELLENSIDAGATHIHIQLREGGKTYLSVRDNGAGMDEDDLLICVERHATSKLPDNNLFSIQSFGFRGEALAAISAIARVKITTRTKKDDVGRMLCIEGGLKQAILPTQSPHGTMIEVRDLFYATPARLKFLKSTPHELNHCMDVIERIALAHPSIGIEVVHNDRTLLTLLPEEDLLQRFPPIMPEDFLKNTVLLEAQENENNLSLRGYISLSTYHSAHTQHQYFFINNRPVKDKVLHMAVKLAYQDYLPPKRHGLCCLFLTMDPMLVDVNVHPAKTEVRFLNNQMISDYVRRSITEHLKQQGTRTSTELSKGMVSSFSAHKPSMPANSHATTPPSMFAQSPTSRPSVVHDSSTVSSLQELSFDTKTLPSFSTPSIHHFNANAKANVNSNANSPFPNAQIIHHSPFEQDTVPTPDHPLGYAKAQLFKSYVVAQAKDALYIVDQHAAAERLLYEKLKHDMESHGITRQLLLLPEIITLKESERDVLMDNHTLLENMGIILERFGMNQIIVKEVPALLNNISWKTMISNLANDLLHTPQALALKDVFLHKLATIACHHSVRFGQELSSLEMNALLRDIENTPFAQQCNHGRPSFIRLEKKDLERLFERG